MVTARGVSRMSGKQFLRLYLLVDDIILNLKTILNQKFRKLFLAKFGR